ncbi:Ulp1 protease family, carboxy-terminal domain protein, partial [Sesbania bispinosa]
SLSLDVDNMKKLMSSRLVNMNKVIELILNKMTDLETSWYVERHVRVNNNEGLQASVVGSPQEEYKCSDNEAFAGQIYKRLKTSPKSDPPPKWSSPSWVNQLNTQKKCLTKVEEMRTRQPCNFPCYVCVDKKEASSAHRQTNVAKKEPPLPPIGISGKMTKLNLHQTLQQPATIESRCNLQGSSCKFMPTVDMGLTTTQLKVCEYVFNDVQNSSEVVFTVGNIHGSRNDFLCLCLGESIRTKVMEMAVTKGTWKQHHVSTRTVWVDAMKGNTIEELQLTYASEWMHSV